MELAKRFDKRPFVSEVCYLRNNIQVDPRITKPNELYASRNHYSQISSKEIYDLIKPTLGTLDIKSMYLKGIDTYYHKDFAKYHPKALTIASTGLCNSIMEFTKLQELRIIYCTILDRVVTQLATWIGNNSTLIKIDFNYQCNGVDILGLMLKNPNLTHIRITYPYRTILSDKTCEMICCHPSLTDFTVTSEYDRYWQAPPGLIAALRSNTKLRRLELNWCQLTSYQFRRLVGSHNIQSLHLNPVVFLMSKDFVRDFRGCASFNRALRHLEIGISNRKHRSDIMKALLTGIKSSNIRSTSIVFPQSKATPEHLLNISAAVSNLHYLELKGNMSSIVADFFKSLTSDTQLESIRIWYSDELPKKYNLANYLACNANIRSICIKPINFRYMSVQDVKECVTIMQALTYNSSLIKLNIPLTIDDLNIEFVVDMLSYNSTLTHLKFYINKLSAKSNERLSAAFKYDHKIEHLGLIITDSLKLTAIADLITHSQRLTCLKFYNWSSQYTSLNFLEIANALIFNRSLKRIDVGNIDPNQYQAFNEALKFNPSLQEIRGIINDRTLSVSSIIALQIPVQLMLNLRSNEFQQMRLMSQAARRFATTHKPLDSDTELLLPSEVVLALDQAFNEKRNYCL